MAAQDASSSTPSIYSPAEPCIGSGWSATGAPAARPRLCAHQRTHRVLKVTFGRTAGANRKDHGMGHARGAKARDEVAAALSAAEGPDAPHVGVAQRFVRILALALAPELAHFGELI